MKKFRLNKNYLVLLLLFLIINTLCLFYRNGSISALFYIDVNVVVVANTLLFILAMTSMYLHIKSARNPNPQAFVRGVMLASFLKFFVLGLAAILYLFLAKANKNIPGVIIGMALYIVYAVVEVRAAYKMNKNNHQKNG